MSCFERHSQKSPLVGQALCYECYDYAGAVLFNANAGVLMELLGNIKQVDDGATSSAAQR
jgi:hypothetical protein